ncbi:high affinity immunoglobulin gamma Fc receptor I-like [Xyrichtys novacula]|nr:high affinity immunoglobulin gamma Fc receptor I-like [Xyrichtys novacula]
MVHRIVIFRFHTLIVQDVRMDMSALCLLLFSVRVSPDRSQFYKYENFSVSCEDEEGGPVTGWRVMRRQMDEEVHPCPSLCHISGGQPRSDSGEYWCQSEQGATSSSVNISVSSGLVLLHSPVRPVKEGDNVTLSCKYLFIQTSSMILHTEFFKDGLLFRRSSTGNMTLRNFSRSDEGLYKCAVIGSNNESPESWVAVRRAPPADQNPPANLPLFITPVLHLVVGCPYLLCTILLGLIYRDRKRGRFLPFPIDFDVPEIDGSAVDACGILSSPSPDTHAITTASSTTTTKTTPLTEKVATTAKKTTVKSPPRKPVRPQPQSARPTRPPNPSISLLLYLLTNNRRHAVGSPPRRGQLHRGQSSSESDEQRPNVPRAGRAKRNRRKMGLFSSEDSSD